MSNQPTLARRALGARLRRLRDARGESPAETAAAMGYHRNLIGRIESGVQGIKKPLIEALCKHFEVSPEELSHLTTLAIRGKEKGWWEPYVDAGSREPIRPDFPLFLESEQVATLIRVLETEVIPGLLQTLEYLEALQAAQLPIPPDVAEAVRGLRAHRQKLMADRTDLPRMQFLISRSAIDYLDELRPEVRDGQKARLLEVAAMPNAEIRVITKLHAGTAGSFAILTPPEEDLTPLVYIDDLDGCRYIENQNVVFLYEQAFTLAREMSVPIEEYLR